MRVMLVDDQEERAEFVERSLLERGYQVVARLPSASGLLYQMSQHQPDIVIIDLESPGRDVLESLAIVNAHNPSPVVMFSAEDDPAFIQQAVAAGVSGYHTHGFQPDRVKPVIDVAIAQFQSFQALRHELNETRTRMDAQHVVARAKELLQRQRSMSESQAHRALQKLAMDAGISLPEAAASILNLLGEPQEKS